MDEMAPVVVSTFHAATILGQWKVASEVPCTMATTRPGFSAKCSCCPNVRAGATHERVTRNCGTETAKFLYASHSVGPWSSVTSSAMTVHPAETTWTQSESRALRPLGPVTSPSKETKVNPTERLVGLSVAGLEGSEVAVGVMGVAATVDVGLRVSVDAAVGVGVDEPWALMCAEPHAERMITAPRAETRAMRVVPTVDLLPLSSWELQSSIGTPFLGTVDGLVMVSEPSLTRALAHYLEHWR